MNQNNIFDFNAQITNLTGFKKDFSKNSIKDYYNYYCMRLLEIAIARFSYKNLPEYIPTDMVERTFIFTNSVVAFMYNNELRLGGGAPTGDLNWYGYPVAVTPYSPFGVQRGAISTSMIVDEDCFLAYNNTISYSDMYVITFYAKQLAVLKNTIDINMYAQKTTQIFGTDKKNEHSIREMFKKMQVDGEQAFFTAKDFDPNTLSVYTTPATFVADKVQDQFENVWSEALTALGTNNVNIQKKERLLTDEVNANNQEISKSLETRYNMRKQLFDKVNDEWGYDIEVVINDDIFEDSSDENEDTGDDDDAIFAGESK